MGMGDQISPLLVPARRVAASWLSRDVIEPLGGDHIQRVTDKRGAGIQRGGHLDFREFLLTASGLEDGHDAVLVAHIQAILGEQQPD